MIESRKPNPIGFEESFLFNFSEEAESYMITISSLAYIFFKDIVTVNDCFWAVANLFRNSLHYWLFL
jgi:hypothetical protein